MIPAIKEWLDRWHSEISYVLIQFLTGRGGLNWRPHLDGVLENPEHVLSHFQEERRKLEETLKC